MPKIIFQKGQKFGDWTILEPAGQNKYRQTIYLALCICGITKTVIASAIKAGRSKSCFPCALERINKAKKGEDISKEPQYFGPFYKSKI